MVERVLDRAFALQGEPWRQAEIFVLLAQKLSSKRILRVFGEALRWERKDLRAKVLAAVAPRLDALEAGEKLIAVWACLGAAADSHFDYSAQVIKAVSPLLEEPLLGPALKITLDIANPEGLAALAPFLNPELLTAAVERVFDFEKEWMQPAVLAALAPALTGKLAERVLNVALTFEQKDAAPIIAALIPQMDEETRLRVLKVAFGFEEKYAAAIIAVLIPHLDEEPRLEVLKRVLEFSGSEGIRVLLELLPHLFGENRAQAIERALDQLRWAENDQGSYFEKLLFYLTTDQKKALLRPALEKSLSSYFPDSKIREVAVREIDADMLPYACELVMAPGATVDREDAMLDLAPRLDGDLLWHALAVALPPPNADRNAQHSAILRAIAPRLTAAMLQHVIEYALGLPEEWSRSEALTILAPQLHGALLQRALSGAVAISDGESYSACLSNLSGHAQPELKARALQSALQAALAIPRVYERPFALGRLAPFLTTELLARALEAALALPDDTWIVTGSPRLKALRKLVAYLRGDLAERVLQEVSPLVEIDRPAGSLSPYEISRRDERALQAGQVLVGLAGALSEQQKRTVIKKLLNTALHLKSDWDRCNLLEPLAAFLTGRDLLIATKAALALYPAARIHAVSAMARRLSGKRKVSAWSAALDAIKEAYKPDDRGGLLAQIVPEVDESLLERCIEEVRELKDESQSWVLGLMAPRLTGETLKRAVDAAFAVQDGRAGALAALAKQFSGNERHDLLERAVTDAFAISSPRAKAWALAAIPRLLCGSERDRALSEGIRAAEAISEPNDRAYALANYLEVTGDKMEVVRSLRSAIAQELHGSWDSERKNVLALCASERFFCLPVLSNQALNYLLQQVMSICEDWSWL